MKTLSEINEEIKTVSTAMKQAEQEDGRLSAEIGKASETILQATINKFDDATIAKIRAARDELTAKDNEQIAIYF
jgi:uracil phosphoribosyltransferase